MRTNLLRFIFFYLVALLLILGCGQQAGEETAEKQAGIAIQPDQIPALVMEALNSRFPDALIQKCTREEENGRVIYDIEFTQQERKFEADVFDNGTIHNWEKEIAVEDLPGAALAAAEKAYPGAGIREIMQITAVTDSGEALEGYEILLTLAKGKNLEITVAASGTLLEDSGEIK